MKAITAIALVFVFTLQGTAQPHQRKQEHREKIRAHKIGFLTEKLDLSPEEAQKFWPLYNELEAERQSLQEEFIDEGFGKERKVETMSDEELDEMILQRLERQHPIEILEPVVQPEDILKWTTQVWDINIDQTVRDYMINLVNTTRNHPDILLGGSPRATLSLFKACQAFAAIHNRDHVLPDDVKYLAAPVLSHRLLLKPEAELRGTTSVNIIERIVETTPLNLKDQDDK